MSCAMILFCPLHNVYIPVNRKLLGSWILLQKRNTRLNKDDQENQLGPSGGNIDFFFFIICFELIDHLQVLCSSGEHIMFLIPGMLPEHTKVRGDMWSGWACFSLISPLSISSSLQHETELIKPFWSSAPAGKILIWRFFKHTTADIRVWKSNTSLLVPDSLLTWCRDPGGSSTRLRWTTSFFTN